MTRGPAGVARFGRSRAPARRGLLALIAVTVFWSVPAPAQESIPDAVRRMEQTLREMDLKLREMEQGSRELRRRLEALEGAGAGGVQGPAGERVRRAPGERFRDCDGSWCPELVVVPAGSFMMGSPSEEKGRSGDEGPVHQVTIAEPFAVGVYEVRFDEWEACRHAGGCAHGPHDQGWGRDRRPVINVSWEDAREYVRWLSRETGKRYRLLSESEWEYVARAGTRTSRYWGDCESGQCAHANGADQALVRRVTIWNGANTTCDDGHAYSAPVGSFAPNSYGLQDVIGNVVEWVEDCWHQTYTGAPVDGRPWLIEEGGNCSRRILRGGAWGYTPDGLRSAFRNAFSTGYRGNEAGLRVARQLD